jgi:hypothetical protein
MAEEKKKRVVVRVATDPELLVMGRIERILRAVPDSDARNRIVNYVAGRDWSDRPIPYVVTEAGQVAATGAK